MVGVGAMVGAGIFVLCGVAMNVSGPGAILAFALNGVVTFITAFAFAELAAVFPEAGGAYVYAKKVFPIDAAFGVGWVLWFAYVVACALYSLGFASFAAYTIHKLAPGFDLPALFPVVAAVGGAGVSAVILATRGAGAGNLISVAKVVAFLILIGLGIAALGESTKSVTDSFDPFLPFGFTGVLSAMGFTFIALEGYEIIAAVSEDVKDPERNVPRAMFLSIGITLVVYMGLLFVILTVGGPENGSDAWQDLGTRGEMAVAVAAKRFGGGFGEWVVVVAGLLATFSALSATLLAASRISFAMARDRALPRRLSRLKGDTPVSALYLSTGLVALIVIVTGDVGIAGAAASLVFLVLFALANAAGLLVRMRVGPGRGFRAPLYPLLPIAGITCCLGLAFFQAFEVPEASLVVCAWLMLGCGLYLTKLRHSARTVSARSETFDADLIRLRGRAPLVLVPIANPESAEPLVYLGQALAAPGVGRVLALGVAEFDPARPDSGEDAYKSVEAAMRMAVRAASKLGRPFEGVVRLASNAPQVIVQTAAERRPETILFGMSNMDAEGGTDFLEGVIQGTRCDVVVLNAPMGWSLNSVSTVLVPVATGASPHNPLRARVLGMLMRERNCAVRLLQVVGDDGDDKEARRGLLRHADDLGLPDSSCLMVRSSDPAGTIIDQSQTADLVVLGLGNSHGRRRLIGDFAREVVGGAACPVVAIAQVRQRH